MWRQQQRQGSDAKRRLDAVGEEEGKGEEDEDDATPLLLLLQGKDRPSTPLAKRWYMQPSRAKDLPAWYHAARRSAQRASSGRTRLAALRTDPLPGTSAKRWAGGLGEAVATWPLPRMC